MIPNGFFSVSRKYAHHPMPGIPILSAVTVPPALTIAFEASLTEAS